VFPGSGFPGLRAGKSAVPGISPDVGLGRADKPGTGKRVGVRPIGPNQPRAWTVPPSYFERDGHGPARPASLREVTA